MRDGTKAQLWELRCSATDDLSEALTDWEAAARSKTKGKLVLYHAYVRIRDDERLSSDQWWAVMEKLERGLGLAGCPRAMIPHDEGTRGVHVHLVWSRYREGETLAPLHHDRRQFHEVARWAEREFCLQPVTETRNDEKRLRDRDIKALKSRGMDKDQLRKILLRAWSTTTDGQEFRAALDKDDVLLLKGDRRDYVIDVGGFKMNPVRLLPGVTAAEFRARVEGLDVLRETPPAQQIRGRKAKNMATEQVNRNLANDEARKPPKRGFNKNSHRLSKGRDLPSP